MEELIKLCQTQIQTHVNRQALCRSFQNDNIFGGSRSYWGYEELIAIGEELKWTNILTELNKRNEKGNEKGETENEILS